MDIPVVRIVCEYKTTSVVKFERKALRFLYLYNDQIIDQLIYPSDIEVVLGYVGRGYSPQYSEREYLRIAGD